MAIGLDIDLSKHQGKDTAVASEFDKTSGDDQVQSRLLSVSGTYVMEVATFCFRNGKKPDKPIIISPTLANSSKGGINLVASLKVVDGTSRAAVGDYITVNIPVWPKPTATQDEISKMFKLSKPRMCALLGVDNFKLDINTLVEKFSTEWSEDKDGKFTLTKDHALKGKVVCVFEDTLYENRETLKLVNLRRFKEGDKSVSNGPAPVTPQEGFGSAAHPIDEQQGLTFADTSDTASAELPPANAPSMVQTDDLPF